MEHQLWNLFRETGDPVGYLLYRAERQYEQARKCPPTRKNTQEDRRRATEPRPPIL